ncbi:CPBP family intramembrane glutamic endopeptidase [Microbispora rosea]|uniref:CPBP family intramembrane glutamic endopeptidase n=1 Tax=Microbispora rosea TaxID=58117 RepID=UPI0034380A83
MAVSPARRDLLIFLGVAFGLSWLIALPLWLGEGLGSPLAGPIITVMSFTPALGVLAVQLTHRGSAAGFREATGLTMGPNRKRTIGLIVAGWLGVPLIAVVATVVSAMLGLVSLDFGRLSLLRGAVESATPAGADVPDLTLVAASQVVGALTIAPLINSIVVLGEELGWRGWLLPRLAGSQGVLKALAVTGFVWGLWHAPLTLLGYNYPDIGPWAALAFTGFCVLFGMLVGWLRLSSGSLWPAILAHGSLNACAGLPLLLGDATEPPNMLVVGLPGFVGWAFLAVLAVVVHRWSPIRFTDVEGRVNP